MSTIASVALFVLILVVGDISCIFARHFRARINEDSLVLDSECEQIKEEDGGNQNRIAECGSLFLDKAFCGKAHRIADEECSVLNVGGEKRF